MFENLLSLAIRLGAGAVVLGWGLSLFGGLSAKGCLLAGLPVLGLVLLSMNWSCWRRFKRLAISRAQG